MAYAHLHLHTHYSLLDGANKVSALMSKVSGLDMPAVAITDHGNMFGVIDFYRSAVSQGVKPIIGCEVYVAPGSRKDRSQHVVGDYERGGNDHLILLASNDTGYRNLSRMVTQSYRDGFYYKPRIDKELLGEFNEGLICLSGCLSGEVASAITAGRHDIARRAIEEYQGLFGDRYYLEIQDNRMAQQRTVNEYMLEASRELSIPLVATNDCHYLDHDDHLAHEVLLCVQTGKTMADEDRWKLDTDQLFVKGEEEMLAAFPDCPEAVTSSVEIAERCDVEITFGKHQFPVFSVPEGTSLDKTLAGQARAGLAERGKAELDDYRTRLEDELEMITRMDFAGYFLIVADFVNWAKAQGIPVGPGRGSAAGSLVSWALGITDIDPIPYKLLFERFLNPERRTMPDIDVDFCYERRDEVVQYVRDKYGKDCVANIITFGTLKGRAAIRDVGRALGFSFAETDRICKLYPAPVQGRDHSLEKALSLEPKLEEIRKSGDREKQLFDHALKLEGLARHVSKHAAGIVISDRPLVESVPLYTDKDGTVMTQFAGPDIEALGLIKFDFLGLKTLTLLDHAVRCIRETRDEDIDLSKLPADDTETYRLIARADTVGVFQMQSDGMRKLLTQLKPVVFEDLVAVLALFRPGPLDSGMVDQYIKRRNGEEAVRFPDDSMASILRETHGVIVYQEQVMQIAQAYAGYTLGEADNLRRAMGKKKAEVMAVERQRFMDGAKAAGHRALDAEAIFQQVETFAAYGFNKSHSAAYAMISYQTAYLKAHYPREFLAALMTIEMADTDKTYKNMADCRARGIRVLPPDINSSEIGFTVSEEGIRFGLGAVKGIGEKAIEMILEARQAGPFDSLGDFLIRRAGSQINRRTVEGLIKSGAFDLVEPGRARLVAALDPTMAWASRVREDRAAGQMGLFAGGGTNSEAEPELPDIIEWDNAARLEAEHEVVGFYISGHPLDRYTADLSLVGATTTSALGNARDQSRVAMAGVTNTVKRKNSRKGDRYATFNREDREGVVEVIAWPKVYSQCEAAIVGREPLFVTGTLETVDMGRAAEGGNGDPVGRKAQVIAAEIIPLTEARRRRARSVDICIEAGLFDPARLGQLKDTMRKYPGACRPYLRVTRPGASEAIIELPADLTVDPNDRFLQEVESLAGLGSTVVK
ncbi:MAG: DNA polymerase III subunit alpha [Deltaproteobacteria bacterium]